MELTLSEGSVHFLDRFVEVSDAHDSRGQAIGMMLEQSDDNRTAESAWHGPVETWPDTWQGLSALSARWFHRKNVPTSKIEVGLTAPVENYVRKEMQNPEDFHIPYNPRDCIEAAIRIYLGTRWDSQNEEYQTDPYPIDGTIETDREVLEMNGDEHGILVGELDV